MIIRFCSNNTWALDVVRRLENEFPRLRVKGEDCLRKCGICRESPFIIVGGEVVSAGNSAELYQKVVASLTARQ